ncbi:RING finger protein nhl-1-like [Branchiostoma lanceolatum]|uniref:RING finger protein nhl-1-like n=1 Tax=Branchiostoma lanceolatum TaxID=7740 RepID=UPI00345513BA
MEQQIEQLLTCPVCLDRYKRPKILPCQHTFCQDPCLQQLADPVRRKVKCPECRAMHNIPPKGISGFPNNITILKFLDLPAEATSSSGSESCQVCRRITAVSKCFHCPKRLCDTCKKVHSSQLKVDIGHQINQIWRELPKLTEAANLVEKTATHIKQSGEMVKMDIKSSIDQNIRKLREREQILLNEVDLFLQSELRLLRVKQENLEVEMASIASHCDSAESKISQASPSAVTDVTDAELLSFHKQSKEYLVQLQNTAIDTAVDDCKTVKFTLQNSQTLHSNIATLGQLSSSAFVINANTVNPNSVAVSSNPPPRNPRLSLSNEAFRGLPVVEMFRTSSQLRVSPSVSSVSPQQASPQPANSVATPAHSNNSPRVSHISTVGRSEQNRARPGNSSLEFTSYEVPLDGLVSDFSHVQRRSPTSAFYRTKGMILTKFGSKGSDLGHFTWPRGVAVSPENYIIVADSSNHRVQVFTPNGQLVRVFGSYGTGEGEFDCLAGVTVNSQGWIVTADRYNHRVQIFDSNGRFIRQFGQEGSRDGQLSYPWGVATDRMGFIYVCDKDNHRVQVFRLDGAFVRKFGRLGNGNGQFENPHYIAVARDNKVIVSDSSNHRIQVFDKYGRFLLKFGHEGCGNGQFKYPRGVAVDQEGHIIVGDSGNNRLQVFRQDGSFLCSFGTWGSGDGEVKGLEGVALMSRGNVVVSDRENHRIQVF